MNSQDLVGYTLSDVFKMLREHNLKIGKISRLAPPKQKSDEILEHYRVVRVKRNESGSIDLLVCNPFED